MTSFSIKIIKQKGCPKCQALEEKLTEANIEFTSFDAFSKEGRKITSSHMIMFTPTALFLTSEDKEIARAQTFEEVTEIIKNFKSKEI